MSRAGPAVRRSIAAVIVVGLAGCTPPEAERVRGGGPGADPGNRDLIVETHGGSVIYYNTPCVTTLPECDGPLPGADEQRRRQLLLQRGS